jgi:tetratricopeptide (TPR) repeat protein
MNSIATCLIVRNEEGTIERCLESVRPFVDEVNVYDTGSTDGTLELLEELAKRPGAPLRVTRGEWREDFAWAREQSFSLASESCSWLLWIDADDELEGGDQLRQLIATANEDVDAFSLAHDVDDSEGLPAARCWRERVVRRAARLRWRGAVHEVLVPTSGKPVRLVAVAPTIARVVERTQSDTRWDPDRNLKILLAEEARCACSGVEPDGRTFSYLGREHRWRGMFAEAAQYFRRALSVSSEDWGDLHVESVQQLAACLRMSGDAEAALKLVEEVCKRRSDWSPAALEAAECAAALGDWRNAAGWARRATELPPPVSAFALLRPAKLAFLPPLRLAEASLALGETERALAAFQVASARSPAGSRLNAYLEEFVRKLESGDSGGARQVVRSAASRYDDDLEGLVRSLRLEAEGRQSAEAISEKGRAAAQA